MKKSIDRLEKNVHNKENQCTVLSAEDLILLADLVGDIHFFRTVYAVSADDFSAF